MGRYIHTVNCDATDVAKEVEDKISFLEDGVLEDSVQLVLTDPPFNTCLLYTSPSPRDGATSRMPSSA